MANKITRIQGYSIDELRALRNNICLKMAVYLFDIINYDIYEDERLQALELLYYLKLYDSDFEKVKTENLEDINIETFKEFINNKKEILELMLIAIIDKARANDNASLFIKAVQFAKKIGLKFN